jgi:hypothetical protein
VGLLLEIFGVDDALPSGCSTFRSLAITFFSGDDSTVQQDSSFAAAGFLTYLSVVMCERLTL